MEIYNINRAWASSSVRAFVPALSAAHASGVGASAALALPKLACVEAGIQGSKSAPRTAGVYVPLAGADQVQSPIQMSKPKNSTTESGTPPRGRPV